jgi:hypothetical protein
MYLLVLKATIKRLQLRKYEDDIAWQQYVIHKTRELLDFWYYDNGANIIPAVSRQKTAKKDFQWDRWQKA